MGPSAATESAQTPESPPAENRLNKDSPAGGTGTNGRWSSAARGNKIVASFLPAKLRDFQRQSYWYKFYQKADTCEWYGSVEDYKQIFDKVVLADRDKSTVSVLHIGCGTGGTPSGTVTAPFLERLSETFKLGGSLLGINISGETSTTGPTGVASAKSSSTVQYRNIDVASENQGLNSIGETFDVVIDKGFLDFFLPQVDIGPAGADGMPNFPKADVKKASEYLSTVIDKLLRSTNDHPGVLFLLTMGQNNVVKELVRFSQNRSDLKFRVYLVDSLEKRSSNTPEPFLFIIEKHNAVFPDKNLVTFEKISKGKLFTQDFFDEETGEKLSNRSIWSLFKDLRQIRLSDYYINQIKAVKPGHLQFVDLVPTASGETSEYSLSIYDTLDSLAPKTPVKPSTRVKRDIQCHTAALIAPISEQHHWYYSKAAGQEKLAHQAQCKRLVCIFYKGRDDRENMFFNEVPPGADRKTVIARKVQEDLGCHLVKLAIGDSRDVPLLAAVELVSDYRKIVMQTSSFFAEKICVADSIVDTQDEGFGAFATATPQNRPEWMQRKFMRRVLAFDLNPRMAQSEIWYYKNNDDDDDDGKITEGDLHFEHDHVTTQYHMSTLLAVLTLAQLKDSSKLKGIVLGLGGGNVVMLLQKALGDRLGSLLVCDIDECVVDVAHEFFAFTPVEGQTVTTVSDAVHCIRSSPQGYYDFVVLDINGDPSDPTLPREFDGLACPAHKFVTDEFLTDLKDKLDSDGILIMNVVIQGDEVGPRLEILRCLHRNFTNIFTIGGETEVNVLHVCSNRTSPIGLKDLERTSQVASDAYEGFAAILEKSPAIKLDEMAKSVKWYNKTGGTAVQKDKNPKKTRRRRK